MNHKILIVDDFIDTVELLRKRFKAEGYETAEAYDGVEALAQVKKFRPDLVILDINMPKLNGMEVCRQMKTDEKDKFIPVLMLSAKSELPDKVAGLDIGADDYLTKPFEYKELAARVRSLLAKKDASEKLAAEEKTIAVDYLVDEIAHEVRNPLMVIGGFTRRMLKNTAENDLNRDYLRIVLENVEVLEKMVNHLVELKGTVLCYFENTDINELVLAALKQFDNKLAEQNIIQRTNLLPNLILIPVDRNNIRKAFANIIENAIDAMIGAKRNLTITTSVKEEFVAIEFTDTGKGIPENLFKNIYDPFYSSKTYGPGLGLTFALKTIQSHGGMISLSSKINEGSTFTVKLPVNRLSK